jgi:hypothetical protein
MIVLIALVVLALLATLFLVPAAALWVLLHILAALTLWPVAINFWACYVIAVIIGLFLG